ncbi:hypothetical protein BC939DRAFT_491680 [Gamsiella multidivaricata]|uniref:uncharacterized protein n=1 Tax=Gamsiella multidivaricata TaxID=101098 RepID=UPI00221FB882|nr:uncharacterized protein BC939DRAFT_491680 [Gamsiella multidivaricata]KAG0362891.1 hypothetical protein BGZ54_008448 [Gamsiella multidivaricata]KAI7826491.1 hypothetical protein BC939DRAFT_491680 [Gamsiella multidivaricata]
MVQLLESTRNYLKTSTRLGRRMSHYRDETSGSETSLPSNPNDTCSFDNGLSNDRPQEVTSRRHSTRKRLSGLFTLEGRNKNPQPEERQSSNNGLLRKIGSEAQGKEDSLAENRRRDSKSSERTHRSSKSRQSGSRSVNGSRYQDRDYVSEHMEHEVPRGRSPTLSMSNTVSTTTSSSYDVRPTDYPNIRQYHAHVWRRNLLEESIMHSLKLGYAERQRSTSRSHAHPSKKDSPRARRAREQAILAAATGRDLASASLLESDDATLRKAPQENIIDRSLKIINSGHHTQPTPSSPQQQQQQQQQQFRYSMNSPYQLDYNASMANITHSFTSFTLELPEHQVSHVMASSAVPELFKIRGTVPGGFAHRPRSRRNSRASLVGGVTPSPRVLTGKKPVAPLQTAVLPNVEDEGEDEDEDEDGSEDKELESPLTPTSAAWADSVVGSFDKAVETKNDSKAQEDLETLEAASARAG